jgi:hypothetical protein
VKFYLPSENLAGLFGLTVAAADIATQVFEAGLSGKEIQQRSITARTCFGRTFLREFFSLYLTLEPE